MADRLPACTSVFRNAALLSVALAACLAGPLSAQDHWVAAWAAAPQAPNAPPPPNANNGQPPPPPNPAVELNKGFHDQTVRMTVRPTIGGSRVRIVISNAMGKEPLAVGAAHIALHGEGSAIAAGSDHALTFGGKPGCSIPPGAMMMSDPVNFAIAPLADLSVSLFVQGDTGPPTMHGVGLHTTYISGPGDHTGDASISEPIASLSWYWLSAVHVMAPASAKAIVTFGDSITDGATSTPDTNRSWPSVLASRLAQSPGKKSPAKIAVVNEGISGNRLLHDIVGPNALARIDRDVFSQPGVKWMTVMEGINDIGFPYRPGAAAGEEVTTDQIIGALRQIAERAHMHGIKVIASTLTPFEGAAYYSEKGEEMREAVNQWIRTGKAFDAVVDFDEITRDPANPKRLRPEFNDRDHLHPNDAGYKAMAEAINLSLFAK